MKLIYGNFQLAATVNREVATSTTPAVSVWFYLNVSWLALGFIPVVSQGGKRHILNQLLELLISGNKVCLTVNLHQTNQEKDKI